jgi:hypothetical protein
MTPLEERIRRAMREKADQVPGDAVSPLTLPVRPRRASSLAYGGGQRTGAPAWRGWLAPAASAVLVAAVISGWVVVSRLVLEAHAPGRPAVTSGSGGVPGEAAAWVATQVSPSAAVSCDPLMCQMLQAHGMPAGHLDVLGRRGADPLDSAVIVATPAVRRELGGRLGSFYAPVVIASFGSGSARIEVRVIAPDGAAAYFGALRADLASRITSGTQMLRSPRITMSAAARRQVLAGYVDSRLLITIVSITGPNSVEPVPLTVLAFGDPGPGAGAGAGCPLRSAELAPTGNTDPASSAFTVRQMIKFLDQQKPPYAPAWAAMARLPSGQAVLRLEFAAPTPLGLLDGGSA